MPTEASMKPAEQAERAAGKKPARQPATKSLASPRDPQSAGIGSQRKAKKADKHPDEPRPSLVRDSFTMPEADFALLATLKATAIGERRAAKKSELLRAGLHALAALDARALVAALDQLEAVKTGRPKKGR